MKKLFLTLGFVGIASFSFSQIVRNDTLITWSDAPANVVIPEGVKVIASHAFLGRSEVIESVKMSSTVESIEDFAFFVYKKIKKIELNEGLKQIGLNAFAFTSIKELVIPESVEELGNAQFQDCSLLEKVTMGSKISECAAVFSGCPLKEVIISPENEHIVFKDNAIFTKDGKTLQAYAIGNVSDNYDVPEGCTKLERYAFWGSKLKTVNIPATVGSIGFLCFVYSFDLKDVRIGDCQLRLALDKGVFSQTFLNNLTIEAMLPPSFYDSSFGGEEGNLGQHDCTLHIPEAAYKDYEDAGYFPFFKAVDTNIDPASIDENVMGENNVAEIYCDGKILKVRLNEPGRHSMKIYTMNGTVCYQSVIEDQENYIDISSFGWRGLYIVTVGKTAQTIICQ